MNEIGGRLRKDSGPNGIWLLCAHGILIDAHIIHFHLALLEIGIDGVPRTAHRHIQDHELRIVVGPCGGILDRRVVDIENLIIHHEGHLVGRPVQRVDVKRIADGGQWIGTFIHCGPIAAQVVQGTLNPSTVNAPMLNDVDFSAIWPGLYKWIPIISVGEPQHPNGRPGTHSSWKFCAYIDPSVGEGKFGIQARRRVVECDPKSIVGFPLGDNVQFAILHIGVVSRFV